MIILNTKQQTPHKYHKKRKENVQYKEEIKSKRRQAI